MSKFWIDLEFIERESHYITVKREDKDFQYLQDKTCIIQELVSIGIVSEYGPELYLVCNEFNADKADNWVKENVLNKIPAEGTIINELLGLKVKWFSKKRCAEIITDFISEISGKEDPPEFYMNYGATDFVVFYSLFGRLIDKPAWFPWHYNELQQMLEEKLKIWPLEAHIAPVETTVMPIFYKNTEIKHICHNENPTPDNPIDIRERMFGPRENFPMNLRKELIKQYPGYPSESNTHIAIYDARWNKKFYEFIEKLWN